MNSTYHLTSTRFTGTVVFEFNPDGFLIKYDVTGAQLSEDQTIFILQKLPRNIGAIQQVLGKSKEAKLTKIKAVAATFEMFWDKYDEKGRSSKKKCQTWWNRQSQAQRDAAYNFIDQYLRSIPAGLAKKLAESYLNAELWNN
jgi:hypothetical protein